MSNTCPKRIRILTNKNPDETNEQYVNRIYGMFLPLMRTARESTLYRGKRISIPDYGKGEIDQYRAFFNHLIKYDEVTHNFSYQRLATCCLLPSLLIYNCDTSCKFLYDKESTTEKNRRTLFCEYHGFVIAYFERSESIFIITAYHVSKKKYYKYR